MDVEISKVALIKKDLSNEERMQFDMQFAGNRKNPTTALIFSPRFHSEARQGSGVSA